MSTIEQLKTFGKVKNSYAGLDAHDDIAITVLFASHFFDDDQYFEWLDEWFSQLPHYEYQLNEDREKVMTILHYLDIYENAKDDEEDEDDGLAAYAAQGFGQLTQQAQGTYGSLFSVQDQQYPYNQYIPASNRYMVNSRRPH